MHSPARPRTRERAGVRWYAAPTAGAVGGVFVGSGFVQGLHGLFLVWGSGLVAIFSRPFCKVAFSNVPRFVGSTLKTAHNLVIRE